jgi:hypothetical protein
MTLSDAYNVPEDQSAHANRVVYVNFVRKDSSTDINLLPTPATIKVGFIGPVYDHYLEVFRKNKPVELTSRKVKKEIQDSYEDDDDNKTTASTESLPSKPSSSIYGGGDCNGVTDIRVPVIPNDPFVSGGVRLDLPKWISEMIGSAKNLVLTLNPAGMYTFNYKRAIHDIDRDTIALALAVNCVCRQRGLSVASQVNIVWHIAASNEHRIREKLRAHAEDHGVLQCVRLETRA